MPGRFLVCACVISTGGRCCMAILSVDPIEPSPPRNSRLPRGLSAFQHRNYRLFFSGQLISVTGTWMQSLAQSWLVLSLTDSPFQFSLVTVCQFAPVLFLAVLAG